MGQAQQRFVLTSDTANAVRTSYDRNGIPVQALPLSDIRRLFWSSDDQYILLWRVVSKDSKIIHEVWLVNRDGKDQQF